MHTVIIKFLNLLIIYGILVIYYRHQFLIFLEGKLSNDGCILEWGTVPFKPTLGYLIFLLVVTLEGLKFQTKITLLLTKLKVNWYRTVLGNKQK